MRLLEQLPELPEGEGRLWTHSTGGEHATKFAGEEQRFNPLREAYLSSVDGHDIAPITRGELFDMLIGDEYEVVFVDRQDLPPETPGATGLVAGAVATRIPKGKFEKTVRVNELLVHPDLRQRGIASFMLGKLAGSEHYGAVGVTELVLETSFLETEYWLLDNLHDSGFKHIRADGSPAIWLPGTSVHLGPETDTDDPDVIKDILRPMPADWNGYFRFYPETDFQFQVFRKGKLVGIVRPVGEFGGQDEQGQFVRNFELKDAGGTKLDELERVSDSEAIVGLLNNYELVPDDWRVDSR